jgi:hypothetical protein
MFFFGIYLQLCRIGPHGAELTNSLKSAPLTSVQHCPLTWTKTC